MAEWKRENEESRWCSSAKSETQRIIRKEINTVRLFDLLYDSFLAKRQIRIIYSEDIGLSWFQSFFLKVFNRWKTNEW